MDTNTIVLRESLKQMDSLVHQAIPGIAFFVFERGIAVGTPFLEQGRTAILSTKVCAQGVLKAAAESHGRAGFLFPPAVEVAVAVAARASEIVADLREAIDHQRLSGLRT